MELNSRWKTREMEVNGGSPPLQSQVENNQPCLMETPLIYLYWYRPAFSATKV